MSAALGWDFPAGSLSPGMPGSQATAWSYSLLPLDLPMDAARTKKLAEALLLRAQVALDGGPQLDAKTEASAALQLLEAICAAPKGQADEE